MPPHAGAVTAMLLGYCEFLDLCGLGIFLPDGRAVLFPPCQRWGALADCEFPASPAVADRFKAKLIALFGGGFDLGFKFCDLSECLLLSHLVGSLSEMGPLDCVSITKLWGL